MSSSDGVLVTGGAGFVGSHLVRCLEAKGDRVVVIDDLSTGRVENLPTTNPLVSFQKGDICDRSVMRRNIRGVSLVIHLAAAVGTRRVASDPAGTIRRNVDGTRVVIEECAQASVPLVHISSSSVYQFARTNGVMLHDESVELHPAGRHPISLYAETKLMAELLCDVYRRSAGLRYLIVRPFNLIGPGQSASCGGVVPTFVNCALEGRALPVYGDGNQTRVFSDVRQAVELLWALASRRDFTGQVVNLATNDKEWRIVDLAYVVGRVVGKPVSLRFMPHEEALGADYYEPKHRRPCLTRLQSLLKTCEPIAIEQTIAAVRDHKVSGPFK